MSHWIVLVTLLLSAAFVPQASSNASLVVTEKSTSYELTVPTSRLVLTIPKDELAPAKLAADQGSPRYFYFEAATKLVAASGWFEPEQSFKGMSAFWSGEESNLIRQGFRPASVAQERVGSWQVVLYDIALPGGGRSSNMRAELVQAGTWIDLHLSVTGRQTEEEGRSRLRKLLGTLTVTER
ncbi:MAG TPA: hypothetical protein VJN96_09960 [Vicinamibacterales bacterium]|nr:hypothetical protein [Vicinamibacterales bacterium]